MAALAKETCKIAGMIATNESHRMAALAQLVGQCFATHDMAAANAAGGVGSDGKFHAGALYALCPQTMNS
jgi:hypothetical protein